MLGGTMQELRIRVPDEVYWWLVAEGTRDRSTAKEHAALLLKRAYDLEHPDADPSNGDQIPAVA